MRRQNHIRLIASIFSLFGTSQFSIAADAPPTALYRFVKMLGAGYTYHTLTTSCAEFNDLISKGWHLEGVIGYVWKTQIPNTHEIYRLTLPSIPGGVEIGATAFFFTPDSAERDTYRSEYWHWKEGDIIGYMYPATGTASVPQPPGTTTLFRGFNPTNADWVYSIDSTEHQKWPPAWGHPPFDPKVDITGYVATSGDRCDS